jgi:hypothetical protein
VKPKYRGNYGDAGDTWYGLLVLEEKEEECDNEELINTITTLVALLAQKDAQIAELEKRPTQSEYDAVVAQRDARPTVGEVKDARLGSVVLQPDGANNNVKIRFSIEETDDFRTWTKRDGINEVTVPLEAGRKFYRFALEDE